MKHFSIGASATAKRTYTRADLAEYAALGKAEIPGVAGTIPGPLLGAIFSYLLGTRLPGPGTNYLKQRLEFPAPAFVDQELTATVEVVRVRPEKELVNLRTVCVDASGQIVCTGEALVLVQDVE